MFTSNPSVRYYWRGNILRWKVISQFLFFPLPGPMCGCKRKYGIVSPPHLEPANFKPQKVLILTKLSRYEFEKRRHPDLTEKQLEKCLRDRGSDYNILLYHHYIHKVSIFRV